MMSGTMMGLKRAIAQDLLRPETFADENSDASADMAAPYAGCQFRLSFVEQWPVSRHMFFATVQNAVGWGEFSGASEVFCCQ